MSWQLDGIKQRPQTQASTDEQLRILHAAAARLGLYDAADWLWKTAALGQKSEES